MFRKSARFAKNHGHAKYGHYPLNPHKFQELSQWQRNSMGLTEVEHKLPGRTKGTKERFNAEAAHITRGTSAFAWKWRYNQQSQLPNLRPEGQAPPIRSGKSAWPDTWDKKFAAKVLSRDEEELRHDVLQLMTRVIHEETQKDGYELRRLDFESRPLSELPERDVIENFVLEEETIRERVVTQVVEEAYRFSPTSDDMKELRNYASIADYIVDRVETCRQPNLDGEVSAAVKEVLENHELQPELGFELAAPGSRFGDPILDHWERSFHHDWQFGKAVYIPRSRENTQGNVTWMQEEQIWQDRQNFKASVESGEAERIHREKIRQAQSN